jgi:hypothetical protein
MNADPASLSVGHFWPMALTKGGVKAYAAVVKGEELLIIELFYLLCATRERMD